jgi:hypothetical protein
MLDRVVEAPAVLRAGHAGRPCTAEVTLRRRPGEDRFAVEFAGLDPACPTCREMRQAYEDLRDRWF